MLDERHHYRLRQLAWNGEGREPKNHKYIMMKITPNDLPALLVKWICTSVTTECLNWLQTKSFAKMFTK